MCHRSEKLSYPGLLHTRQRPLFQIFQILKIAITNWKIGKSMDNSMVAFCQVVGCHNTPCTDDMYRWMSSSEILNWQNWSDATWPTNSPSPSPDATWPTILLLDTSCWLYCKKSFHIADGSNWALPSFSAAAWEMTFAWLPLAPLWGPG